jgi:enoyl-CoA hydratase/carnithine racemase
MSLVEYDLDVRGVATITLHDPATRNALSDQLLDELISRLEQVRANDSTRVVVLRSGDDRVFSSGGDLKAFVEDVPMMRKYADLHRFPRVFRLLGQLGRPSICAAGGDVLAGAFGLALACDLIVARAGVRFGCPEINVGLFPFMISALIYRSVPRAKANELMMTGQLISAEEAERLHVVNTVVPPDRFADEVDRWAGLIASRSPLLMRMGKDAVDATRDQPLDAALRYLQGQLALASATEDLHEGVAAFRGRRQPRWSGR